MKVKRSKHRVNVITLGCSKNLVDSEFLMRQLDANGLKVEHDSVVRSGDTVIINTCGFIKDSKEESIDTIMNYIKAKENGIIGKLYVMGCLSERYKKDLEKEIPEVDKYFGVNNIKDIIETIGYDYKIELTGERLISTPNHYAYLKISEGCDRHCSFCAIPGIRGKHISKPLDVLVREAENLVEKGVKELILYSSGSDLLWI
jgi:ribosomal protein S12 methylthiotransferase